MKIIELILDEENEDNGITAISVVENPAIEEDFIALKNQEVKFAEQDKEKHILMGAALIPNIIFSSQKIPFVKPLSCSLLKAISLRLL